jgi:hypothetical protein
MARAPQGASRFFTTAFGALSATTTGTSTMGMSSVRASVWALPLPCPRIVAHSGAAPDKSGWTMWHAQDRRQRWKTALTAGGEPTTACMAKTLPSFVIRSAGIAQQGGRRHLAIASALVRARRAMRPQSTRPRLRAVAQPSTPCSAPTVILKLQAPVFSAAQRTPQTHIAFQAWRGDPACTITPASLWGGSTVILCRTLVRTRRSAPVGRSTGSGGSETPTFTLYLAITNRSYVLSGAYGGGGGWGAGGGGVVTW